MTTNLFLIALFVFCMIVMSLNLTRRKKKVMFYGTSINDLDVVSGGYIAWVTELMKEEGVEDDYVITHSIRPADKINDLYTRLNNNLLIKDATIAVIYPGLNDVLQPTPNDSNGVAHYEELLQTIVEKIRAVNTKVILCTPLPVAGSYEDKTATADMQMVVEAIRNIAQHPGVFLVDLNRLAADNHFGIPQQINQLVAREIWKVIKEIR